jgi:hypothetical protein
MQVTLICSNAKSQTELLALDGTMPNEFDFKYLRGGSAVVYFTQRIYRKYDPDKEEFVDLSGTREYWMDSGWLSPDFDTARGTILQSILGDPDQ